MVYQTETLQRHSHVPNLSCPQCQKEAVVQHGSLYVCLNCHYRKDVSEVAEHDEPTPPFLTFLLGGFLLLLIL